MAVALAVKGIRWSGLIICRWSLNCIHNIETGKGSTGPATRARGKTPATGTRRKGRFLFMQSMCTVGYCMLHFCVCVCVCVCVRVGVNLGTVGVLDGCSTSRVARSKASDGQV